MRRSVVPSLSPKGIEHRAWSKRQKAQGARKLRDGRERREKQKDGLSDLNCLNNRQLGELNAGAE